MSFLRLNHAKQVFQLALKYEVNSSVLSDLVSDASLFSCLDVALAVSSSKLLSTCHDILRTNKAIFEDDKFLKDIHLTHLEYIVNLDQLPVTNEDLFNFCRKWKAFNDESGEPKPDMTSIFLRCCERAFAPTLSATPLIWVKSEDANDRFSISYNNSDTFATLRRKVTRVRTFCSSKLTIKWRERDLSKTPKVAVGEIGLKENDVLILVRKFLILCTGLGGKTYEIIILESDSIYELRHALCVRLSRDSLNVKSFDVTLILAGRAVEVTEQSLKEAGFCDGHQLSFTLAEGRELVGQACQRVGAVNLVGLSKVSASSSDSSSRRPDCVASPSDASHWKAGSGVPQWLCFEFANPTFVGRLQLKLLDSQRDPHAFQVEASHDGQAWQLIADVPDAVGGGKWLANEVKTFPLNFVDEFRFYRFYIRKVRNSGNPVVCFLDLREGFF